MQKIKIHAHRGASGYAPENTLISFRLAVSMRSDGIECDIHRTADGRLVVCHDATIDRTSDGTGAIKEMTLAEIQSHDFTKKFYGHNPFATAPSLEQMLDVVKDMDPINIEIKEFAGHEEEVFELFHGILKDYGCIERVIVSSFNVMLLGRLKARYPDLKTGYLYHPMIGEWMRHGGAPAPFELFPAEQAVETALSQNCDAIHPCIDVLEKATVDDAHAHGLTVNVWTCNTVDQVQKSIEFNVDGIITNYPDWVRTALEAAGRA